MSSDWVGHAGGGPLDAMPVETLLDTIKVPDFDALAGVPAFPVIGAVNAAGPSDAPEASPEAVEPGDRS